MNRFVQKAYLVFAMLLGVVLLAGCHGDNNNDNGAALTAIAVTPANPSIALGLNKQFIATGTYSDGTSSDISSTVTWSSTDSTRATINTRGLAIGVATGDVDITATVNSLSGVLVATTTLTITDATLTSLVITPITPSIARGLTKQFVATGIYSDGTSPDVTPLVSWSSTDPLLASINANGLAKGVAVGKVMITASFGAEDATTELSITDAILNSIALTPKNLSIANGLTQQFTATGTYSDGISVDITATASWSSADTLVATVNANGLASSIAVGTSLITATFETLSTSSLLTVTDAALVSIAVMPNNPSIAKGLSQQLIATGTFSDGTSVNITTSVIWSSGDTLIATMNPNAQVTSGLAHGVNAGNALITATKGSVSANTTLTVTAATLNSILVSPINSTIPNGLNQQFAATGTYSDNSVTDITAAVTWSSNDTFVASVKSNGLATGMNPGSASISATLASLSNTTTLTVISATLNSIDVTPTNPSIVKGSSQQFVAKGNYSNGESIDISSTAIWSSSDILVATMNPNEQLNSGRASAIEVGSSIIQASLGGLSADTTLDVTDALLNNPLAPEMGEIKRFVILASQTITTTSGSNLVNGDVGILDQARSYYAGFTPGVNAGEFTELTNGLSYAGDDSTPPYVVPVPYASMVTFINQSRTDLGIAYNFLAADPNPNAATQVCPIELGNLTLTRGVYKTASDVTLQTGTLTLDGEGDPDSVFIFSIGGNLTSGAPGGDIVLINGAQAKNVYWRTAGKTVIGTNTSFYGNVFAWSEVNVLTGANVTGRLFAVTDQVTLDANAVTKAN
ncbi:ice-binding family protein [Shewanella sp. OMA3-2]|uniref:ice-binding family protein n=1 Tax=Shewanella sp. OMA3-2 TaxID=2908650 RepID=UPI001F27242C|nr:ice-binding family protein [Shewanella sp. OMA3-2]UJF21444.1 Ig-like domain-containing protein [Shewanella sp. OMA3-2]